MDKFTVVRKLRKRREALRDAEKSKVHTGQTRNACSVFWKTMQGKKLKVTGRWAHWNGYAT